MAYKGRKGNGKKMPGKPAQSFGNRGKSDHGKEPRESSPENYLDVFEESEDEALKAERRRKSHFDEVDNYELQQDIIDSEDDEEIDSDEAFGEGEEETYSTFRFAGSRVKGKPRVCASGSQTKSVRFSAKLESSESEEEKIEASDKEDEESDGDYITTLDLLDEEGDKPSGDKDAVNYRQLLGLDDSDEESASNDAPYAADSEEDGDQLDRSDSDKADKLSTLVESLTRNRTDQRRTILSERFEAYDESEYNLPITDPTGLTDKINLQMLVSSVGKNRNFTALNKSLQSLKKSTDIKTLHAPLPKRLQDEITRKTAYRQARTAVSEWAPVVEKLREASHLHFSGLTEKDKAAREATLVNEVKPVTDMEKEVAAILSQSGFTETQTNLGNRLETNKLSPLEVLEQRNQQRLMRELMLRHERKAKRVAKIKSKAYRKIKRREMERASTELTGLESNEMDPEERLRLETERARERMSLRHKNTGKWAKSMLRHGQRNDETRQALMDQLNRHETLRRRMEGKRSGSDSDSSQDEGPMGEVGSAGDDNIGWNDDERAKEEALAKLDRLAGRHQPDDADAPKKGVFAMKFMQNALKLEGEQVERDLQEVREEIAALADDAGSDEEPFVTQRLPDVQAQESAANPGRRTFKGPEQLRSTVVEPGSIILGDSDLLTESTSVKSGSQGGHKVKLAGPLDIGPNKSKGNSSKGGQRYMDGVGQSRTTLTSQPEPSEDDSNPWLMTGGGSSLALAATIDPDMMPLSMATTQEEPKVQPEKPVAMNTPTPAAAQLKTKPVVRMAPAQGSQKESQTKKTPSKADSKQPNPNAPEKAKKSKTNKKKRAHADQTTDVPQDNQADNTNTAKPTRAKKSRTAKFAQRELVQMAFADDDVVAEFEQEKQEVEDTEQGKDQDITLPGWGTWGGMNVRPSKKRVIKKAHPESGISKDNRMDRNLNHVIVYQKQLKKSHKYMVPLVPQELENRAVLAKNFEHPLGKEWNTGKSFQKLNKPRLTKSMGTIIQPMLPSQKKVYRG